VLAERTIRALSRNTNRGTPLSQPGERWHFSIPNLTLMNFIESLTEQEKEFFKCLQQVDVESIWGLAISNVVKNPDIDRFRGLVIDLKSQARDSEGVMLDILGEKCFDNLLTLQ
jgi:hypothetical protein